MRTLLFTLISLGAGLALAATVYKWVDENGVVHYSDQPHTNAQKVHVQAVQTYKSVPTGVAAPAPVAPPEAPPPAYDACTIAEPMQEQSFANINALIIRVSTDPSSPYPGDQIYLVMDGQPLNGGAPTGNQFTLSPVDRGTHTVQAVIRDARGTLVCQSPGVTFNVHQASLRNPANHVRPH